MLSCREKGDRVIADGFRGLSAVAEVSTVEANFEENGLVTRQTNTACDGDQ